MSSKTKGSSLWMYLMTTTLWEGIFSQPFQLFLIIGSNIQSMAILYWTRFSFITTSNYDALTTTLNKITKYLTLLDYLDDGPSYWIIVTSIFFTLVYIVIYLVALSVIFIHYLNRKKLSKGKHICFAILNQFHISFGFWFTTTILISILINPKLQDILKLNVDVSNLLMSVLSVILLLLNYLFGIFSAVFSFDPFPTANTLSCHTPIFQILTFVFKAIIPFILVLQASGFGIWLITGYSLVIFMLRHYYLIKSFPYYEYSTMKIAGIFSIASLLISVDNIIALILKESSILTAKGIIYLELMVIVLCIKYWNGHFKKMIFKSLFFQVSSKTCDEVVIKKFFSLRYLMKNTQISNKDENISDPKEVYLWGLLKSHIERSELEYPMQESDDKIRNKNLKQFYTITSEFKQNMMQKFLKEDVEMIEKSNKLKMIMSFVLAGSTINVSSTVLYLAKFTKMNDFDKAILSKLNQNVQKNMCLVPDDKKSKSINVRAYIEGENISTKFLQMLHLVTIKYIDYWTYYQSRELQIQTLFEKNKRLEKEHDEIQNFWVNTIESNPVVLSSLLMVYSLYLFLIRSKSFSAGKILKKYHNQNIFYTRKLEKDEIAAKNSLEDINTFTLHASMSKDKLGKVLYVSSHVTGLLDWNQQDIVGKNVNTIMPLFMQEVHNQIMLNHLRKMQDPASSNKLNQTLETYIIDKAGAVSVCQVYLSIHPAIQDELIYIAIVKIKETKDDIIFVNENGYLEGYTKKLSKLLNLNEERRVHLREICREHYQLIEATKADNNRNTFIEKQLYQKETISEHSSREKEIKTLSRNEEENMSPLLPNFSLLCQFSSVSSRKTSAFDGHKYFYNVYMRNETLIASGIRSLVLKKAANKINQQRRESREVNEYKVPNERVLRDEIKFSIFKVGMRFGAKKQSWSPTEIPTSERHLTLDSQNIGGVVTKDSCDPFQIQEPDACSSQATSSQKDEKLKAEQEFDEILNLGAAEASSVTSVENRNTKMEQAIYAVPREQQLHLLRITGLLFIILSPPFVLYFETQNHKITSLLEGNIDVMSQTTLMLTKIVELNRLTRLIMVADAGLINTTRFRTDTPLAFKAKVRPTFDVYSSICNRLNNNIKNSIYKLDKDLQTKLYQYDLVLYELDYKGNVTSSRTANLFVFVGEIAARGAKLARIAPADISSKNPDIYFIANNTLNDFLVVGEQIVPIFLEDSQIKLNSQSNLIIILFSSLVFFSLLIMFALYNTVQASRNKRDQLLNILLRLENKFIIGHLTKVRDYKLLIEKGSFNSRTINFNLDRESFYKPIVKSEQSNFMKKVAQYKGINSVLIWFCVSVIFFICLLLSVYIILILMASQQKLTITKKMNLMAESNMYLFEYILSSSLLYEYVQENTTTKLRNNPMKEEWHAVLGKLSKSQQFYITTLFEGQSELASNMALKELIQGNLCRMFPAPLGYINALCLDMNGGLLTKGIIGMNSLMIAIPQMIITMFDDSPKTFSDMYQALNIPDIYSVEVVDGYYIYKAYSSVYDLLREDLFKSIDGFKRSFESIIITYTVLCFILGTFFWLKIIRRFENDLIQWRKMIRQVPWEIILQNKLLKGYLNNNSQSMSTYLKS